MIVSNYLISGSSSGLGKYLHEKLGGSVFDREGTNVEETEVVIHSAFNQAREVNSENLYQYFIDNVFLTKKLAKIPHKKFIYISSVDVYPKSNKKYIEDEVIDINQVSGIYAITKLISESIVRQHCSNHLILRCTSLLGKDSRENSLIKILKSKNPTLTLSANSVFNYILHTDILDFIKLAIQKDLQGIYNLASSENITLSDVANLLKKQVNYGTYEYNVGNVDNKKAIFILPNFKKTSKYIVAQFIAKEKFDIPLRS